MNKTQVQKIINPITGNQFWAVWQSTGEVALCENWSHAVRLAMRGQEHVDTLLPLGYPVQVISEVSK